MENPPKIAAPRPWKDFLRMKKFVRPYTWRLAAMLALSLAGSALGLAQPYLSKYLVDGALMRRDLQALSYSAILMFGATVLGFALTYISGLGYMRLSAAMLFDMRQEVYRHLLTLSPRFHARARLGDLVSRLNGDVAEVQRISADSLLASISNIVFAVGSLVMMIYLSWQLFIVGVVLVPLATVLYRFYQVRLNQLALQVRERSAAIGALFVDVLPGFRLVACSNASGYELARFGTANQSFVARMLDFQKTSLMARTVPGTVLSAAAIAVFLFGGREIILGQLSIGTLVAFMAYHSRLLSPVQSLLGLSSALSTARVSLGRVLELLDTDAEVRECEGALPIATLTRQIQFKEVTLLQAGRAVLDRVSFVLPANKWTVITGQSGAGKSTIADLLVRLYDPDHGQILVDGTDMRRLSMTDLRRTVMLIEQSPYLMHGTLHDNIAYARPGTPRAAVESAARGAGLADLLDRLPSGLDTEVGERGLTLSAGERQRVAIARAFLAKPEVLILDEPSAAIDAIHEEKLLLSLRREFAGKTIIAITHKLALVAEAGHVLRIENGRIASSALVLGGAA